MKWLLLLIVACPLFSQESAQTVTVAIIGGGPAGLTCGMRCAKAGYATIVCDSIRTDLVDPGLSVTNWPGRPPMTWEKTMEELRKEYIRYGGKYIPEQAESIVATKGGFTITTATTSIASTAVVIATGTRPPTPPYLITSAQPPRILPRLWDPLFLTPNDTAAIIGSGETAMRDAIRAAVRAKKVYLFLKREGDSALASTARKLPSITLLPCDMITAVHSLKNRVLVEYVTQGSKMVQEASWAIMAQDWLPNSALVQGFLRCESSGAIVTSGSSGVTSTPGAFACGEVSSRGLLSGIAAASDGLTTSEAVIQFLLNANILPRPQEHEEVQKESPTPKPVAIPAQ